MQDRCPKGAKQDSPGFQPWDGCGDRISALKGRNNWSPLGCYAPSGLMGVDGLNTQGWDPRLLYYAPLGLGTLKRELQHCLGK